MNKEQKFSQARPVFLLINLAIMLFSGFQLWNGYVEEQNGADLMMVFSLWTLIGSLLLVQVFLVFRRFKMMNMLRMVLYVVTLLQAINLMVIAKDFLTLNGSLMMVYTLIVVIYLIGQRGFITALMADDSKSNN